MPYAARKGEGDTYDVYNTETDEVKASHEPPDAEEKANRQVKLLNEIEKDPAWEAEQND
jgi:hypothetical protein